MCMVGTELSTHPSFHLIFSTFEVHTIIINNIVILRSLFMKKPIYLQPSVFPIYFAVGNLPCE